MEDELISEELKRIYDEDQKERNVPFAKVPKDYKNDEPRLARVLELIKKDKLKTGADFLHAAIILQHSIKTEHYYLAHKFAKKAADMGYKNPSELNPLWLSAAALDRALMSEGKPQKFGTQFRFINETKKWAHWEYDPHTTDEERAKWNVPPLEEIKKKLAD